MATKLDEIERRLWAIADDLRANSGLKASEYSEPVLGTDLPVVLLDEDGQVLDLHPFYQLLAHDDTHHETHLCFFKQRKAAHKRLEGESVQGAFSIDLEGFDDLEVLLAKEPKGPQ